MHKVYVITYNTGYDSSEIVKIFANEQDAEAFVSGSKYGGPFVGGYSSKDLCVNEYDVE